MKVEFLLIFFKVLMLLLYMFLFAISYLLNRNYYIVNFIFSKQSLTKLFYLFLTCIENIFTFLKVVTRFEINIFCYQVTLLRVVSFTYFLLSLTKFFFVLILFLKCCLSVLYKHFL